MNFKICVVQTVNIENLKNALKAELNGFNSNDLTQLVHGLCLFMGYPSCLCKPKKSVGESLEKISKELKGELNFYKCLLKSISKPSLNCSSCSTSDVVCKCCVLDCISKVQGCECVKGGSKNCSCSIGVPKRCCKDLLEKLKASLSLLNLKADMESLCQCPPDCCDKGVCTKGGSSQCPFCINLKTSNDYTVTGLGLLRPSPIRLAGRLEGFFGSSGPKGSCSCQCGTSGQSCCCLACENNQCVKACSCRSSGQCSCDKKPLECPRKKFCEAIQNVKVLVGSSEMRCCESGKKCHCSLAGSGSNCQSGCCVVTSGSNSYQSLKCLLRRVVKFFKDLSLDPSDTKPDRSRICCELVCVVKTCHFIRDFYNKNDSKAFKTALETLQYSGPCGHELYRLIDGFLQGCVFRVAGFNGNDIIEKIKAAQKKCSTCNSASTGKSSSCDCCSGSSSGSSGNCLGCKDLLKDSKLMSVLLSQYVSSYDSSNAKWEDLCPKSASQPCFGCLKSCPCRQTVSTYSSYCTTDPCCADCNVRSAAKIFLGMLPCLYYGLKILYDRCQDPVTWPDWSQKKFKYISVPASVRDAPDLKKFLDAWGFESSHLDPSLQAMVLPGLLENLFSSESSGNFDKIYKEVSEKYFSKHVSDPSKSHPPTTVRSMLLWLYGLRFHKHFSDLVENCKSLCSPFGNSFNADAVCYYLHTCCFILPVAVISTIETSDSAQNVFSSSSEISKFLYPSDPSKLFETFCEYVRKIFAALNFLSIQCRLDRDSAGWKDCAFGQGCKEGLENSLSTPAPVSATSCCKSSVPKGILCTSVPGHSNYHEHCTSSKPDVKCIGLKECTDTTDSASKKDPDKDAHTNGKCKESCPHPLQRFLVATSESKDYPFALPGITPMGFSQGNFPKKARWGQDLYNDIAAFCESGFYPLTRLVQFILCVSQRPPETLLDLYAFFKRFAEALNSKPELSSRFVQWINDEPGSYPGKALQDAIQNLYGSSHSSGDHSVASLFSLSSCHANRASKASCGPYLHALTDKASGVFTPELCSMYLSWICYRGPTFYSEFKRFHKEAQEKFSSCCQSSSCKKIVECPCALPLIYSRGFQFMSPSGLGCWNSWGQEHGQRGNVKGHTKENDPACTRRTCKNFIDQLEKVVKGDPFNALLRIIDEFIWHIRLPFVYAFLYIWILVISYFYYVQFYKLDLLHIDSHLHLPRSFKILPSTLFSDASSKLKDLSYFTL